jgi:CRISPR-associated protein Csb1
LRRLKGENSHALRRYILGLSLLAATEPMDGFLRTGCLLVPDPKEPGEWHVVDRSGKREAVRIDAATVQKFAEDSAEAFGKGRDQSVTFDPTLAKADVKKTDKKKAG